MGSRSVLKDSFASDVYNQSEKQNFTDFRLILLSRITHTNISNEYKPGWHNIWLRILFSGKNQRKFRKQIRRILGGYHFLRNGGSQTYWGVIIFWEKYMGGHRIDDQNVGSHKMTTDSVFILFKKTDFNTFLACLGGKLYQWWGGHKIFLAKKGGCNFIDANFR